MAILHKTSMDVVHQIRNPKMLKDAIDDINLDQMDELDKLEPDYTAAFGDGSSFIAAQIGPTSGMFGVNFQPAQEFARARAAELVTDIKDSTRNSLRQLLSGTGENLTKDQLADLIQAQNPMVFSAQRAALIAETEMRIALNQGMLSQMQNLKEQGATIKKAWSVDLDPCPTCQANEDEGPIDVDDDFPSGDSAAPAHPNCRCSMYSVYEGDE